MRKKDLPGSNHRKRFVTMNYDELYVVSDLHMGGEIKVKNGVTKNLQIFNKGDQLADFIKYLTQIDDKKVGLVLNGDIVDFLAEENAKAFDPDGAKDKLERIIKDDSFKMVWKELKTYLKGENHHLILVLGNHDIELALPPVKQHLIDYLCKGEIVAQTRLIFVFDGTGFACTVGEKQVLCLHGNEEDGWNVVDYRRLLGASRALNRQLTPPEWDVNAGSTLVVKVMNEVKQKMPFVDLLKPETKPVPAIVLAANPAMVKRIEELVPLLFKMVKDQKRIDWGFLGEDDVDAGQEPTSENPYHELFGHLVEDEETESLDDLLKRTEKRFRDGVDPADIPFETSEQMLGFPRLIWDIYFGRGNPVESLRKSLLGWIEKEDTYNHYQKDRLFRRLDKKVGPQIDFLVAGHSHLHRAIKRDNGHGFYLNCGTWARLLKIPLDALASEKGFNKIYKLLTDGTMEDLDNHEDQDTHEKLIQRRPTVVSIRKENNQVIGRLNLVSESGDGTLVPIEKTDSNQ